MTTSWCWILFPTSWRRGNWIITFRGKGRQDVAGHSTLQVQRDQIHIRHLSVMVSPSSVSLWQGGFLTGSSQIADVLVLYDCSHYWASIADKLQVLQFSQLSLLLWSSSHSTIQWAEQITTAATHLTARQFTSPAVPRIWDPGWGYMGTVFFEAL